MNDLIKKEFELFKSTSGNIFIQLTKRELEVTYFILNGLSNRKIGEVLYISETTVKKHVYNIYNKLDICSRFQLINYYYSGNRLHKAC